MTQQEAETMLNSLSNKIVTLCPLHAEVILTHSDKLGSRIGLIDIYETELLVSGEEITFPAFSPNTRNGFAYNEDRNWSMLPVDLFVTANEKLTGERRAHDRLDPSSKTRIPTLQIGFKRRAYSPSEQIFQAFPLRSGNKYTLRDSAKVIEGISCVELETSNTNRVLTLFIDPANLIIIKTVARTARAETTVNYQDFRPTKRGILPFKYRLTNKPFSAAIEYMISRLEFDSVPLPAINLSQIPFGCNVEDGRFAQKINYIQGEHQYSEEELVKIASDRAAGKNYLIGFEAEMITHPVPASPKRVRVLFLIVMSLLLIIPLAIYLKASGKTREE